MFDLSTSKKADTSSVIPAGLYDCMITEAVVKDTKSGTGEYISMHLTVANGEMKGRKIFTNFNIKNPNAKAVEIGKEQLAACLSVIGDGVMKFPDAFECCSYMYGKSVTVKTKVKADPNYGDKAEVVVFSRTKAPMGEIEF